MRSSHSERGPERGKQSDRIGGLVCLHELESRSVTEPLSRANQAAAFFRISRSSLTGLFFRRRRCNSARSSVVRASLRTPWSRSACFTQFRMAWAERCPIATRLRLQSPTSTSMSSSSTIGASASRSSADPAGSEGLSERMVASVPANGTRPPATQKATPLSNGVACFGMSAPEWIRTTGLILRSPYSRADLHRYPQNHPDSSASAPGRRALRGVGELLSSSLECGVCKLQLTSRPQLKAAPDA
jgi:hypothetical protein